MARADVPPPPWSNCIRSSSPRLAPQARGPPASVSTTVLFPATNSDLEVDKGDEHLRTKLHQGTRFPYVGQAALGHSSASFNEKASKSRT